MEYQLITPRIPQNGMYSAVEQVLINRGIAPQDIHHFLNTTDKDILDPKLFENIKDGAKMLVKRIANGDKVLVVVDCDCDGFTSSALLLNYLNCLFPAFVRNNISYHIHTGKVHGIEMEVIPNDVKLVITPDSASNQFEEHKTLQKKGVDVLVLDHHEADYISNYACVINNQLSNYPTKSLAGVGVVYKFCSYLDEIMNTDYANQFIDLVALGCIADMVELKEFETRHLVVSGINQINNPFFKGMVDKQAFQLKDGITPFGIAFYIAPYVNATIRVGTQEEKLMLFESMLDYRGYELIPSTKRGCKGQTETRVEQACRNCSNIKNRQTKARDASLEIIERLIEANNLLDNKLLIIQLDNYDEDTKSLTGLIANQLMSKYKRPVLLLRKTELGWEGSARTVGDSKLANFKDFLSDSNCLEYCEGHQGAFGCGIQDQKLKEFINYSNNYLRNYDFSPNYKVDFIYDNRNRSLNEKDILDIASLESVWGQGIEEPLIAIENVGIKKGDIQLLSADKNPTLKIKLTDNCAAIKFRSSKEEYENLYTELGCVTINIVGKCKRNIWNGNISPQIIIEDYEIIYKQDYYF